MEFVDLNREFEEIDLELATLEADLDGIKNKRLFEAEFTSKFVSFDFQKLQKSFEKDLFGALQAFQDEKISAATLERRWNNAIASSYPRAYAIGASPWGGDVDDSDRFWLRSAIEAEQGFARNFARDLAAGRTSVNQAKARLNQYVSGLDGVKINGWVEKSPQTGRLEWRLGVAEHCPDCLTLAAYGPYSKANLPTVPRAGSTRCKGNCKCQVVLVSDGTPVTDPAVQDEPRLPSPVVRTAANFSSGVKQTGGSVSSAEAAKVDDLRSQLNYWRRQINQTAGKEREEAIAKRREVNLELIDYLAQKRIRNVPMLSVSDVITARDASERAVEEIFLQGVDGKTLSKIDKGEFKQGLAAMRGSLADLVGKL